MSSSPATAIAAPPAAVGRLQYVIGDANGPVTFSPSVTLPPGGGRDSWVARYRPGGALVWARSLGGSGEQQSPGISAGSSAPSRSPAPGRPTTSSPS